MTKPIEDAGDTPADVETPDLDVAEPDEADTLSHELQLDEIARINAIKIHPRMTMAELKNIYADLLARRDEAFKAGWFIAAGRACIRIGEIQGIWLSYWINQPMPEIDAILARLHATVNAEHTAAELMNIPVGDANPNGCIR